MNYVKTALLIFLAGLLGSAAMGAAALILTKVFQ